MASEAAPFHFNPDPSRAIGVLLMAGEDWLEECWNVQFHQNPHEVWFGDILEKFKEDAQEIGHEVPFPFGDDVCLMSPTGGKGVMFKFSHNDYTIRIRSLKGEYAFQLQLSAEGLWMTGADKVRDRVLQNLRAVGVGVPTAEDHEWQSIIRVDNCMDIHSPEWTKEMVPGLVEKIVAPSAVKKREHTGYDEEKIDTIGRARYVETCTIGVGSPLQVQIYDKGREITEQSGKTWLFDLWERGGEWTRPEDGTRVEDVWRVEARFMGEWLKERGVRCWSQWKAARAELLSEAFTRRRVVEPSEVDTNRARWGLHPFWERVLAAAKWCRDWMARGAIPTQQADALCNTMVSQSAGCMRRAVILKAGKYCRETARLMIGELKAIIEGDPEHDNKVEAAEVDYWHFRQAGLYASLLERARSPMLKKRGERASKNLRDDFATAKNARLEKCWASLMDTVGDWLPSKEPIYSTCDIPF